MKFNKWTVVLAAAGVVSLGAVAVADESPVTSLVSGTSLSGYVDTSAIWKPGVQNAAARFANTAPDTYNGFNLNVVSLQLEKPLTEGQWSAGYKAQLWMGPDASALPGAFNSGSDGQSNLAIKQAYVTMRAPVGNGLDFKIGQFDTIIGYEVADSYANPNFSRSLGFAIEPLSHTGLQANYQVTEWLGVSGGIANTAYGYVNQKETYYPNDGNPGNGTLTYMGAVTLKAPESWGSFAGSSLYAGLIDGGLSTDSNSNVPNESGADTLNYYVGLSMPTPIKQISVGASWDYVTDYYADDSWAQALAGYVSWQVSEKMKLNGRVEYANSNYNAWGLGGLGSGDSSRLMAYTVTLDYTLWANVITRIEMVYDQNLDGNDVFATSGYSYDEGSYNHDGRNSSWLLAANIIYKF